MDKEEVKLIYPSRNSLINIIKSISLDKKWKIQIHDILGEG